VFTQVDMLRQDIAYALRQLRRSPGFATVAVVSLAIGIGANATIYSVAHAFLERPMDAARPDNLVRVYRGAHSPLPRDWFLHFARHTRTLSDLIAEDPMPVGVDRGGVNERAWGAVVSENFFAALGVPPAIGSVFTGRPGDPVGAQVVLTYDYWAAHFGADSGIVGRTIRLNDLPFTIVGVARKDFHSSQFGWGPNLFVPLSEQARLRGLPAGSTVQSSFYITGRLAPGRTRAQVEAELHALAATLPGAPPDAMRPGAFRVDHARGITAEVRTPAAIVSAFLMVVVGVVLLIACANLANLLLARAAARRREVAIRHALGVSRGRLVRQLLTESVVVAFLGGAVGVALALYVTRLIPKLAPAQARAEMLFDFGLDRSALLFTAAVSLGTGLLFGLAPAVHASRPDVNSLLKADSPGSGSRRSRLRSAFLAGQVGLAALLLVAAALFLRGLDNARHTDPGYRSARVTDQWVDLSLRLYDEQRGRTYQRELLERVRTLPQVEAATLTSVIPLTGSSMGTVIAPGETDPTDERAQRGTSFNTVAPGYFEMFAIPIVRGRAFDTTDRPDAPHVVIVNETLARLLWPDQDPLGRTVRFGGDQVLTVVGVAAVVKYARLGEREVPFAYLPATQDYQPVMVLQVRLTHDTPAERAALRRVVQSLDPALPLPAVTPFAEDMGLALLPARLGALLLGAFGALALFLAAIGVYGVTAYLVGRRSAEIGIRSALGATHRQVLQLMMRETLGLVAIGLALGLAAGIALGKVVSSWLYGVGALDPAALGGAALVLLGVAVAATWIPARRALTVDPIRALRSE
jgi:putative ABC transport system permease protein